MLNRYLQRTQLLLNDPSQILFNPADLTDYINEGRNQVAALSSCIRTLVTVPAIQGQETYLFSNIPSPTGFGSIISVGNVSILWTTVRYTPRRYTWEAYQALVRNYNGTFLDIPGAYAQLGDLETGVIYLYPPPSQNYTMEWTVTALPAPLRVDTDPEVLPSLFQVAVPFYAAGIAALTGPENLVARSESFMKAFDSRVTRARTSAMPSFIRSWYGR